MDDEEKILDEGSRSKQTWKNIPRFNMDMIMGKTNDKKKAQEKRLKIFKKQKQNDIKKFLEMDPYLDKNTHFEKAREELDKLKPKNQGINNYRGNVQQKVRNQQRREEKAKFGIFGQ